MGGYLPSYKSKSISLMQNLPQSIPGYSEEITPREEVPQVTKIR